MAIGGWGIEIGDRRLAVRLAPASWNFRLWQSQTKTKTKIGALQATSSRSPEFESVSSVVTSSGEWRRVAW